VAACVHYCSWRKYDWVIWRPWRQGYQCGGSLPFCRESK